MSLNSCLNNIRNFINTPSSEKQEKGIFRVTVVTFEDRCNLNCGRRFADLLSNNKLFEVNFYDEAFPKGFLNLQGRNFFDFIDQGKRILEKNHSDVIVWGYEENGKIRVNFQTPEQYTINQELSFSLLDSLFIPLSYFSDTDKFSASLLLLIYGIIIAATKTVTNEQKENKPKLLQNILKLLADDTSHKELAREFMPFIMNMLGKVYLNSVYDNLTDKDVEIIENLLSGALKNNQYLRMPVYYGCIYNNLGQLYETAGERGGDNSFDYLKLSIKNYRLAQKYLEGNFPYDFGLIAYHLAELHFAFWKHTGDIQALRDAVAKLREAENIYTFVQFPHSWCKIEGLLGYYLTNLGMETRSNDIMLLAINSYHNQQKVYEQIIYPQEWASIQDEIGNIYYLLGKQNDDDNFMYEARNYFNSAIDIYSKIKNKKALKQVEQRLAKVKNYIG